MDHLSCFHGRSAAAKGDRPDLQALELAVDEPERGIAGKFAAEGAIVIVADINENSTRQAAAELGENEGRAFALGVGRESVSC